MSAEKRNLYVNKIFKSPYYCMISPVYLEVIRPTVKKQNRVIQDGRSTASGCIRINDYSAENDFLETLASSIKWTGDDEIDNLTLNTPVEKILTIDKMAEIVAAEGEFILMNPVDSTYIVDIIEEYALSIEQSMLSSAHAKAPPKEDMDKLYLLGERLKPLAMHIREHGLGSARWDELVNNFIVRGFSKGRGYLKHEQSLRAKADAASEQVAEDVTYAPPTELVTLPPVKKEPVPETNPNDKRLQPAPTFRRSKREAYDPYKF